MITLASPTNTPSTPGVDHFLTILQDIVENVDIEQRFCVRHPSYKDYELPTSIVKRLQNLPAGIQQRAWVHHIRGFLYGTYYNGSIRKALEPDSNLTSNAQPIENNSFMGVDLALYERLHQSNQGRGYWDSGWRVIEQKTADILIVQKELKLHIERDCHLTPEAAAATIGDTVAVKMPKNLVQNGYYMAIGDAGSEPQSLPGGLMPALVRVYFNLSPEGSIAVMTSLTEALNEQHLPFSFKTLYNPGDYNRYDAGVLYFDRSLYPEFWPVLCQVYKQHQSQFGKNIPLFTKPLASGVGLAEESDFRFTSQESFGMNRCQIVANGLLAGVGCSSTEVKLEYVMQAFRVHNLDWQRPYLNAQSVDQYFPLV